MTLSEIIVVVATLGLLILLAVQTIKPNYQIAKANDSRRMADLKKITVGLEDYAGDHPCYPEEIYSGDSCSPASGFRQYLNPIPCDPKTKAQYTYVRPECDEFVVYATLELEKEITYGPGNYALSSSNVRLEPTILPTSAPDQPGDSPTATPTPTDVPAPTATPTPGGTINYYGCRSGVCTYLSTGSPPDCKPNSAWNEYCDLLTECCEAPCGDPENPENECK